MSRIPIALKLVAVDQNRPEGVEVFAANNHWKSPGDGWLGAAEGVWNQVPEGLFLMDAANRRQLALRQGCRFATVDDGSNGRAIYPDSGGVGNWTVVATNP